MPFVFLTALADRKNELGGDVSAPTTSITKPIDFDLAITIICARLAHVARTDVWVGRAAQRARGRTLTLESRAEKTSAEIADILALTKRTVDFHVDNARDKLGVSTRTQAAIKAVTRSRLIEP